MMQLAPGQSESALQMAAIVRRIAEQHPDVADPADLTPYFLAEIEGMEAEALSRLVPSYIGSVLRRRITRTADADAWQAVLEERIPTRAGYVFGRDGTAEDFDAAAERRRQFSGNLDARGLRMASVAAEIRDQKVRTAGEVSRAAGVALIRSLEDQLHEIRTQKISLRRMSGDLRQLRLYRNELRAQIERKESKAVVRLRDYRLALQITLDRTQAGRARGRLFDDLLSEGS